MSIYLGPGMPRLLEEREGFGRVTVTQEVDCTQLTQQLGLGLHLYATEECGGGVVCVVRLLYFFFGGGVRRPGGDGRAVLRGGAQRDG